MLKVSTRSVEVAKPMLGVKILLSHYGSAFRTHFMLMTLLSIFSFG